MTIFNCCPGYISVYEKKSYPYNILDQRVADFKSLHNVIDSIVVGVVTNKHYTQGRNKYVMGISNPKQLIST